MGVWLLGSLSGLWKQWTCYIFVDILMIWETVINPLQTLYECIVLIVGTGRELIQKFHMKGRGDVVWTVNWLTIIIWSSLCICLNDFTDCYNYNFINVRVRTDIKCNLHFYHKMASDSRQVVASLSCSNLLLYRPLPSNSSI